MILEAARIALLAALGALLPSACGADELSRPPRLVVRVRNGTFWPIYLKPYLERCQSAPSFVRATFEGETLNLDGFSDCGRPQSCAALQDDRDEPNGICPGVCSRGFLVRLDPGRELEVGRYDHHIAEHGVTPATAPPMPSASLPSGSNSSGRCISEAPLLEGRYELEVRARLECARPECACDAAITAHCTTEAFVGGGRPDPEDERVVLARATVELVGATQITLELVEP